MKGARPPPLPETGLSLCLSEQLQHPRRGQTVSRLGVGESGRLRGPTTCSWSCPLWRSSARQPYGVPLATREPKLQPRPYRGPSRFGAALSSQPQGRSPLGDRDRRQDRRCRTAARQLARRLLDTRLSPKRHNIIGQFGGPVWTQAAQASCSRPRRPVRECSRRRYRAST